MTKGTMRIGFSRGAPRTPGAGGHVGLFHLFGADEDRGRVVSVGYLRYDRSDLEPLRDRGTKMSLTAVGVLRLAPDVTPALAEAVFDRIRLVGTVRADERTAATIREIAAG